MLAQEGCKGELHERRTLLCVAFWGADSMAAPDARAVASQVTLEGGTKVESPSKESRVVGAMYAVEVLLHVSVVCYPHVADGTMVLELSTQLRHGEPLLPSMKTCKKGTALDQRKVHSVFAREDGKIGCGRLTYGRTYRRLRLGSTHKAITT